MDFSIILLFLISIMTALISGVTGVGGGVILLSLLTFFFPLTTLIPIHGVTQAISNSSRIWLLRSYLLKNTILYYLMGAIVGYPIGLYLLDKFWGRNELIFIVAFSILLSIFKPKFLPSFKFSKKNVFIIGIIAVPLGLLTGSIGPFLAMFFVDCELKKEEIVANKSIFQLIVHLTKIPAYLSMGFDYSHYTLILFVLAIGSIIGTKYGVRILKSLSPKHFMFIFKAFLVISAMRLIYKGIVN